jgi:16S rRNA (cytidine1402-2'-O)-methyltransferase
MPGTLYVIATPIGNLEDITLRALRILKEVDLIAAEDTRRTKKLLNHYGVRTPLTSYHEHNEKTKAPSLLARLEQGKNIALVSDAGTPTLSDPGYELVREAIKKGFTIVPVPGASALVAALSVSGLPTDGFVFNGFLPPKRSERRATLHQLRDEKKTLVFYEAPHRLKKSLRDLLEILGDREVVVGREISKVYEEFIRGCLSETVQQAELREWRGEITLVVRGSDGKTSVDVDLLREEIGKLKNEGIRVKEIAEILGDRFSCPKKEVYRLALEDKNKPIP